MVTVTEKTYTSKNCYKYWSPTLPRCKNALRYNNHGWRETSRNPSHTRTLCEGPYDDTGSKLYARS